MKRVSYACMALWMGSFSSCSESKRHEAPPPPPPAPVVQPAAAPSATPPVEPTQAVAEPDRAVPSKSAAVGDKRPGKASTRTPERDSASKPAQPSAAAKESKPAQPTLPPPAASVVEKPRGKVNVPSGEHLRIQLPSGLQSDLDKDSRMQPWVTQVVSVIDRCYGASGGAPGAIEVRITMHENARPDADLGAVPNGLAPVVACATGGLLRTKMPLFTGTEGARYTVRLVFQ